MVEELQTTAEHRTWYLTFINIFLFRKMWAIYFEGEEK